ncbi:MAG: hypothetical protein OEX81_03960 [Candidatus Pacebacteria bacterium]|nr:hypothetical protein [Candidatus Paceibacterota bacterium]
MPIKQKPRKVSKYRNPNKKKMSLGSIIKLILLFVVLASLPIAYYLTTQNQDVRQQAAGSCKEEQVNTEFRKYEPGTDKGWTSGGKMKSKIGDKIDVNCFAKTGSALLSNGKISLKIDGKATSIPSRNVINKGASLKGYEITQGGVHAFTCSNSTCTNTDKISIAKPPVTTTDSTQTNNNQTGTEQVRCTQDAKQCPDGSFVSRSGPNCEFASCPQVDLNNSDQSGTTDPATIAGNCPNPSVADLNNDCSVDLKDYDLFLSEFIKNQK